MTAQITPDERAAITEYLRQFDRLRDTGGLIHSVHTDPDSDGADLMAGDLRSLLDALDTAEAERDAVRTNALAQVLAANRAVEKAHARARRRKVERDDALAEVARLREEAARPAPTQSDDLGQSYCPVHGDLLAGERSWRCANAAPGHERMAPPPVWDEDTVTEAVASALADHRPDLDETAVFTGECDCGWRTPGPAWAASEEEHRPHVATAVLAVVREHGPVKPGMEDIYRAWHGTDDPWGGCADRASIERVLDLWPGESRATVQAEALHDAAEEIDRLYFGPDQDRPFSTGARHKWGAMQAAERVRARADRLKKGGPA